MEYIDIKKLIDVIRRETKKHANTKERVSMVLEELLDFTKNNYQLIGNYVLQEDLSNYLNSKLNADGSNLENIGEWKIILNYYDKTETYSKEEINGFLSGKQNSIGYTPENIANKSDSYTASSSTTYASTKALVDGLATKLDKGTYTGTAQDLKNDIVNLEGINYVWSPTNRTLTLFDREGNQLSQVSLVSLDNEGTDIRYNASTLSLELYNADNELLDSIPVSSFIGSVGTQLQLNSNQLQLRDSQGNILSTVSFSIVNIPGLQTALDSKLNKGSFPGNASDLKTEIDGKLNKPTTTSNTTSYPFVVGEDGNGNSARLPAGDLGKNFFNSDLSNTTARNHTMNAGVTINTLGNPHALSGLPNKNADIANFRKVRVQNTSGLDAVVDSKNLLTDGMTSMSNAEKDAWRIANRKTGETYSTGQPRVDVIFPKILSKQITGVQYMSLIGINLFVNITSPTTSVTMINTSTNQEYLISNIQVSQTNQQILSFGLDFVNIPEGTYRFRVINNGLQNIDTTTFTVTNADLYITNLSALTWAKGVANGTFASSFGEGNIAYRDSNRNSNVGSFSSSTERGLLLVSNEILNTQEANANWWIEIESNIPSQGLDYFGNTYVGVVDSSSSSSAIQSLLPSYGLFIWGNGFSCFPDIAPIAGISARNFIGTVKTHIIKQGSLINVTIIVNNLYYRSVNFSVITNFSGIKLMLGSAIGLTRGYDIDWKINNVFKVMKF